MGWCPCGEQTDVLTRYSCVAWHEFVSCDSIYAPLITSDPRCDVRVQRKKAFKKGIDQDESRRRREESQIQIRKNKREESLNQRRRTGTGNT